MHNALLQPMAAVFASDDVDLFAAARLLRAYNLGPTFVHDSSLLMAAREVVRLDCEPADSGRTLRLHSNCLGLTGVASPLPQETLAALDDALIEDGGDALATWLGILHHRLLHLMHEGVARAQPSTCASTTSADLWSSQLLARSAHAEALLPEPLRLALSAVLEKPSCTAQDVSWALSVVLRLDQLPAPVRIEPMTGGWVTLAAGTSCELGERNHSLGESLTIGRWALAPPTNIDVVIGPVDAAWLAACAGKAQGIASRIDKTLQAVLPASIGARIWVAVAASHMAPWRLGPQPGKASGAQTPLMGLGIETFLGPAHGAAKAPWPLQWKKY